MRLPPGDQLLNTLLSNAWVALQLSTREGFEVKVSEALHKGLPVVATKAGGIPLQVKDGENGYLVDTSDFEAVAEKLKYLWENPKVYEKMCEAARKGVSDEVGTVGNALSWFYLAAQWSKGKVEGSEKWVNDLACEQAGVSYAEEENRLPRHYGA
jgi:glycosyltransferase involved in cell wall biosynthesis